MGWICMLTEGKRGPDDPFTEQKQVTRPGALRFVLVGLSVLLAATAQLLVGGGHLRWAVTPYAIAIAAMGLGVVNRRLSPFAAGASKGVGGSVSPGGMEKRLGLAAAGIAVLLLALALTRFPSDPPYTMAWYSYGAAIILLLAALPCLEGGWTRLALRLRTSSRVSFDIRTTLPWAAMGGIMVLGLGLRLYHLDVLPAGLWYDEAANLSWARQIERDVGATPLFLASTTHPSLFLMLIAAVVDVAGVSMTAGRLVSVAFGLAGIVTTFLLVRLMLGSRMGLVAALLIAVSRWDINWSRLGMHGITAPLFASLTAYLTLRALKSGRASEFGFAGAALGLGMWFYTSYRLFVLVVAFLILHYLLSRRPETKWFLGRLLVMGMVAVAVAAPLIQSAIVDSDEFFARTRATSVFSIMPFGDAIGQVKTSFGTHALMFNYQGDMNPRHNLPGEPMLDPISGVLLVLGLGVALARWRNVALLVVPAWIILMVLPGVLTLPWEAPQSLRSISVIPAAAAAMALALGALWTVGRSAPWRPARRATPVVLAAVLGVIAYLNVNTYFGEQAQDPYVYASFSTDETIIARDMLKQQRRGYSLFTSRQFKFSLIASLLANEPRYEIIRATTGIPIDPSRVKEGASVYLEPREGSVLRLLKTYYPEGGYLAVRPPSGGDVLYYSAEISRAQLEQPKGLIARYVMANGVVREEPLDSTDGVWELEFDPEDLPADLEWTGALHVIQAGEYLFALDGKTEADVKLDGRHVLGNDRRSVRVELAVGLHSLVVTGRIEVESVFLRVLWQPPEGELASIPVENLYHGSVRPVGLAGRFYEDGVEAGVPDALRVTPAMDGFYYDPVVPEPYVAIWEGTLEVQAGGLQEFRVGGAGRVSLSVDGELVAQHPGSDGVDVEGVVPMDSGEHRLRIEYVSDSPPSRFEVLWGPVGSGLKPIPIDLMTPDREQMFRILEDE